MTNPDWYYPTFTGHWARSKTKDFLYQTASHDPQKLNFLWLACPEMDDGLHCVPTKYVENVHKQMTKDVRALLHELPLDFFHGFDKIGGFHCSLIDPFPSNLRQTMLERAGLTQDRLIVREGNVIRIKFGKHCA